GIYPELVVKDFSDETGFLGKSRKDFVVAKDDIYMIRYYPKTEGTGTYSGNFTLFTDKGQKLFFIIEKVSESELREFFSGITDYAENPLGVNRDETDPEKVKKSKAGRIIRINNLLAIAAIVFSAAFYYKTWNYMVFSSACMLLSLSAFLLYIKYNDILAISESGKRKSGKVNIFFTMFLPAVVMLIRTVIDINIIEYTEFAIWSIAVFTVLALMFFFLSSEYKRAKSVILIILLFSVTFSVSAVAQANYIFDTEAPQTKLAVIEKKDFFGDKESPRTFYLYVSIDGIEYKIKVSSEVYNDNEQGENTPVNVYKGFFGIQYAKIL
ncbi:MAG: hypothetical protein PHD46_04350, partial [Eubacteriales bacterium]|nr:hypothetical protein [Eubacteriales bacterium]